MLGWREWLGWWLRFLEWGKPTAVNLSPTSSFSSSQPPTTTNCTFWKEWSYEGANIRMMLVRYWLCIICNAIIKLTSSWLPTILAFIFQATVVGGVFNVNCITGKTMTGWKSQQERMGLAWTMSSSLAHRGYQYVNKIWAICSCCVNMSPYNVFLIRLYLPCC